MFHHRQSWRVGATAGLERLNWDWAVVQAVCIREARRVVGNGALADDAAQEALIRAWRRRDTCTSAEPEAWIRAIARNEALRAVARKSELPLDDVDVLASTEGEASARDARLMTAVQELPERDRLLLLLRYWEDLSYQQVASRLQIPLGTVKVRLHRAHAILRDNLSLEQ